ncbi:hypothetical protein IHC87_06835 [Photobacterium damselae subsp. damselae]|uniref:hypothetical protein n=1 Tax=Photobacterium damselae TaxID=38293 RepID=UPI001F1A7CA7|nr:hypothetical protein [Photobacterium damselae]UJZ95055.1 hypothetical protein IHC87_06835 [Photobacterium damselae subsp. damselae]UJZ99036.1 hypothetical protein IHC88_06825 [Photobacterium damselae subsp. damselae]
MARICEFDFNTFEYNIDSNLSSMMLPTPSDAVGALATSFGALKSVDEALKAGVAGSKYTSLQEWEQLFGLAQY